jgi:hypothetical protein
VRSGMSQNYSRPLVSVGRVGLEKRGPPQLAPQTSRSSGWHRKLDRVERVVEDRQVMWRHCHFILVEHEATQLPNVKVDLELSVKQSISEFRIANLEI